MTDSIADSAVARVAISPVTGSRRPAASSGRTFVVVGAGLAGAVAAQTLREEGFDGRIVLCGEEPLRPYERPPLSKDYLQHQVDRDSIFVHPEAWYPENDVELQLGVAVTSLDPAAQVLRTATGLLLDYDKLLLATGSTPRRLSLPGADLQGVHYLRDVGDSERIRDGFARASRVVIIGAGWIGLETAAAARRAGLPVTLLEAAELPLLRVLGPEVAPIFAQLHRHHGVDLRCKANVAGLTGVGGAVTGVRLGDGSLIDADLVLVGVGITPNTQLAERAGLEVDNGIRVDHHLRTADPNIYAAGDVANADNPRLGRTLRVEHWANARRQGAVAAKAMLGQDAADTRPSYFFSDQHDLGMEYTGDIGADGFDEVVFRGRPDSEQAIVFWLSQRRVLAGMNLNVYDVADDIEQLIEAGLTVDPAELADPDVPLNRLTSRSGAVSPAREPVPL